ncbi:MAG TPA: hypothetical protein VMM38_03185 [Aridibacter sp.]|nr:hypothetical protein [Aridibacter sp.]
MATSTAKDNGYSVGDRVEKVCPECDEQLGHIVKSVTKLGRVSRVICSECGTVGTFKASSAKLKPDKSKQKSGDPYDSSKTYKSGQIMEHEAFGRGKVVEVLENRMIDVLFPDRLRRLIHSR